MAEVESEPLSAAAVGIVLWGVLGVAATLVQAIYELAHVAFEAFEPRVMPGWQIALFAAWILLSVYAKGILGFQRGFSPRVVSRALLLARNPRPLHVVLAPLYCMALFHAKRRNLIVARGLVLFIVAAVLLVRQLPQPWRGFVDAGVVVGLSWGLVCMVVFLIGGLTGRYQPDDSSLPDGNSGQPDHELLPPQ